MHRPRELRRSVGLVALASLCAVPAWAQDPAGLDLTVERDPTAADCPDQANLRGALARAGASVPAGGARLHVRFTRTTAGYEATVQTFGDRSGLRTISVDEAGCAPLVDAVAVSIALLLDPAASAENAPVPPGTAEPPQATEEDEATAASAEAETPPAAAPSPPESPAARVAPIEVVDDPTSVPRPEVGLDLLPTFIAGLTPSVTVGGELGILLRLRPASLRVAASAFLPSEIEYAGGRVEGFLVAARASTCLETAIGPGQFGACATGVVGRLSVEGTGYTEDDSVTRPVWAVGPEVAGALLVGKSWGWTFRATPLFLLAGESFSVAGVDGSAFSVARVSAWIGVGLWSTIW